MTGHSIKGIHFPMSRAEKIGFLDKERMEKSSHKEQILAVEGPSPCEMGAGRQVPEK